MKLLALVNSQTTRSFLLTVCWLLFIKTSIAQTINRAEYFIDTDPGQANGTAIAVASPSASIDFNFTIPTNSVSPGFHLLGFRIRSSDGKWSHAHIKPFYVIPASTFTASANITRGEYFLDTDPGRGNGISIPVTPAPTVSLALPISTTSLTPGFHTISFRFRDNLAKWSHALSQTFYIVPPTSFASSTAITRAEYFFNTDPGVGNGNALPIASGNPQNNTFAIPLASLPPGFHKLGVRYRDNNNKWSIADVRTFFIVDVANLSQAKIIKAEYFVDTDPGIGNATAIPGITAGETIDQIVAINMTGISTGAHTLNIRVKDDKGFWSYHATANFTISACVPPASPSATGASRCESGTLTLSASGASGSQIYRWYDDPILNNISSTGATFTTPFLTASKTYYVGIYDPATLCESNRVTANATINIIAKPIINPSGSISFCAGSSLFLSAPAGFSQYVWSTGATTQQILVTTAGSFTVQVGDGICSSVSSDAVTTVTVTTAPCGGSTNQPPIISPKPFTSQIEGRVEVDLTKIVSDVDNNLDFSTLRIINNLTSRGVPAFIDASYFLQIDYSGNPFTGVDRVTIEVCDLAGACVQEVIDIDVVGAIVVYNGISPDNDGYNDFMLLKYIDVVEGAAENKVTIFNRWGDVVFDIENYNNIDRIFAGLSNSGNDLPSGTYYYKIEFVSGSKPISGFLTLIR